MLSVTTQPQESDLPSSGGHIGITVTLGRCSTTSTTRHGHESPSKTTNYAIFSTSQYTHTCSCSTSPSYHMSVFHALLCFSFCRQRRPVLLGDGHLTHDSQSYSRMVCTKMFADYLMLQKIPKFDNAVKYSLFSR